MADKARYSEAQNKATQKYIHKSYDQISIRVRKDGDTTRETIQRAADLAGLSLNAYILEAVNEKMSRQSGRSGAPEGGGGTETPKYY